MTSPARRRAPALACLSGALSGTLSGALLLGLAGCGGVGSAAEDVVNAVVDGLVCGLRNCTESSTLNVDEISPRFTATQADGDAAVTVSGSLGKSANVFTTVLMARDERLVVAVDGGADLAMSNPDGQRLDYTARVATRTAQPVVQVVFTRAGVRHVNQVTLPPAFSVLQPTGTPLLTRKGSPLAVRLSLATVGTAEASASGNCTRSDGTSFAAKGVSLGARAEASTAGAYRLEPAVVDDSLNSLSRSLNNNDTRTPAVSRCDLTVTWSRSVQGSIAPTMNGHGALVGQRTASHLLAYDAGL